MLLPRDASPLLANAVDALWARIRSLLETLDRGALIGRALVNHEAIEKERRSWGVTASAVLAVHRDRGAPFHRGKAGGAKGRRPPRPHGCLPKWPSALRRCVVVCRPQPST